MSAVKSTKGRPNSSGNFKIASGAIVCSEAQLIGNITVGTKTVIHPTARILAEGGPIIIGSNNLVMENTVIINKKSSDDSPTDQSQPLIIGNGNVFEFDSRCESLSVGDDNVFEAKSFVGEGVVVTERCVIGASCVVDSREETLSPGTVIAGRDHMRWTKEATTQATNSQQLEVLLKLLPNFHRLTRST